MSSRPQSVGRLPVRLIDVPKQLRLVHAEWLMRNEEYPEERLQLMAAAHFPSEHIYEVEADAVRRVMGESYSCSNGNHGASL